MYQSTHRSLLCCEFHSCLHILSQRRPTTGQTNRPTTVANESRTPRPLLGDGPIMLAKSKPDSTESSQSAKIASLHTSNDSLSHFLRVGVSLVQLCHRSGRAFYSFRQFRFRFLLLEERRRDEVGRECTVDRVRGCWARESESFHPQRICQTAQGAL